MTPSHAVKNGMRYRYYVSQPLISKTREAMPQGLRIAAAEIERIVLSGIGELIADPGRFTEALDSYIENAGEQQQTLRRADEVAAAWPELPAAQLRPAVVTLCKRINLHSDRVEIEFSGRGLYAFLRGEPTQTAAAAGSDHPLLLLFPTKLFRIGQGKRLVIDAALRPGISGKPDPKLIKLLVRAHHLRTSSARTRALESPIWRCGRN
jgi:site-specific DNA recombinase